MSMVKSSALCNAQHAEKSGSKSTAQDATLDSWSGVIANRVETTTITVAKHAGTVTKMVISTFVQMAS
jgi:hypothetical protein